MFCLILTYANHHPLSTQRHHTSWKKQLKVVVNMLTADHLIMEPLVMLTCILGRQFDCRI